MATYNGEKFLKYQLDSILGQQIKYKLEIIICDDCSNDKTIDILNEYKIKDPRIKLYFNKSNIGFSQNFNKAISLCSGDYIALADQDDIWELNKLELLIQNIKNNDFVCSNSLLINQDGESLNYTMKQSCNFHWIPKEKYQLFKRLIFTNIVQGSTILAKTDFIKSCLPIPQNIKFHDYWIAMKACANNGFNYLDICTIKYRQHNNNVTNNRRISFNNEIKISKAYKDNYYSNCNFNNEKVICLQYILNNINFHEKYKKYLRASIKYFYTLNDPNLYTLFFFIFNCKYIYLDKNHFRNLLRIIKRTGSLLYWKLILRHKYTF